MLIEWNFAILTDTGELSLFKIKALKKKKKTEPAYIFMYT